MIRNLQNHPLTRWWWTMWQQGETGYICLLPWYKRPGKRWYKCNFKE